MVSVWICPNFNFTHSLSTQPPQANWAVHLHTIPVNCATSDTDTCSLTIPQIMSTFTTILSFLPTGTWYFLFHTPICAWLAKVDIFFHSPHLMFSVLGGIVWIHKVLSFDASFERGNLFWPKKITQNTSYFLWRVYLCDYLFIASSNYGGNVK